MFLQRSYEKEMMDDFSITDERIGSALKELKIINKYLGGKSTSKEGINNFLKEINSKIKILDVGSGGSDNLDTMRINNKVEVVCLDINVGVCRHTKKGNPSKNVVCGDARNPPFKKISFDIVHTSLFLHHFDEDNVETLLKSFLEVSKHGLVINDLRRSIFAFIGIKILTNLFSKSEMVKNDAPLSVKRGFLKKELEKILCRLKFSASEIKHKWAFRWLVVIRK